MAEIVCGKCVSEGQISGFVVGFIKIGDRYEFRCEKHKEVLW
ncbi:unnamed protein product [marine sediment metagenome]|uniref:Uncharacterized protein n=1 Tax=marine sediment metagenome TaxID=412755 RepID=X0WLJ3_9ZZZZ